MTAELDRARTRRRWNLLLGLGVLLNLGPILGLAGTVFGMLHNYRTISIAKAPTPADLAGGVYVGLAFTALGSLAGLAGILLVVFACLKLARLRNEPSSPEPLP